MLLDCSPNETPHKSKWPSTAAFWSFPFLTESVLDSLLISYRLRSGCAVHTAQQLRVGFESAENSRPKPPRRPIERSDICVAAEQGVFPWMILIAPWGIKRLHAALPTLFLTVAVLHLNGHSTAHAASREASRWSPLRPGSSTHACWHVVDQPVEHVQRLTDSTTLAIAQRIMWPRCHANEHAAWWPCVHTALKCECVDPFCGVEHYDGWLVVPNFSVESLQLFQSACTSTKPTEFI